jgi:gamma-glutamyl hydrolase
VNSTSVISDLVVEYGNPLLEFTIDPAETKMFSPLGEDAYIFEMYNMTLNHHSHGVSPSTFQSDSSLNAFFMPTSISYDDYGLPFVATMEAYNYPFFGTQFHPEKPASIFYTAANIVHTETSINYNRYFADFFVGEARRNKN